ncbi:MAG: hypothetical protein AAB505_00060 [Patescibacteria group bacterium]
MSTKVFKLESVQVKIFWLALGLLVFGLVSYIYFVNSIVFNLADREKLGRARSSVTLEIGRLEMDYLSLARDLTIERAYAMGFEEAGPNTSFVVAER